jgi:hypothetical protein
VLFIEYDVDEQGEISLVALVNAQEQDGEDPDGEAWMAWRRTHGDEGWGCAPVPPADLQAMEATEDPAALRALVERIVVADRTTKERAAKEEAPR